MKCVIVANGDLEYTPEINRLIKSAQLIICADGGARHFRALQILPHVMIGDFDSIHPADKLYFNGQHIKTLTFSAKKNHTDSELCVSWALDNNATDITFLGVTGTRMDHTLANIFLLEKLSRQGIPARIIDKNNVIHVVTDHLELKGRPGNLLSIIPLTRKACGITLNDLAYPLVDADIQRGATIGVSNSFMGRMASVSIKKGSLIVTMSTD